MIQSFLKSPPLDTAALLNMWVVGWCGDIPDSSYNKVSSGLDLKMSHLTSITFGWALQVKISPDSRNKEIGSSFRWEEMQYQLASIMTIKGMKNWSHPYKKSIRIPCRFILYPLHSKSCWWDWPVWATSMEAHFHGHLDGYKWKLERESTVARGKFMNLFPGFFRLVFTVFLLKGSWGMKWGLRQWGNVGLGCGTLVGQVEMIFLKGVFNIILNTVKEWAKQANKHKKVEWSRQRRQPVDSVPETIPFQDHQLPIHDCWQDIWWMSFHPPTQYVPKEMIAFLLSCNSYCPIFINLTIFCIRNLRINSCLIPVQHLLIFL